MSFNGSFNSGATGRAEPKLTHRQLLNEERPGYENSLPQSPGAALTNTYPMVEYLYRIGLYSYYSNTATGAFSSPVNVGFSVPSSQFMQMGAMVFSLIASNGRMYLSNLSITDNRGNSYSFRSYAVESTSMVYSPNQLSFYGYGLTISLSGTFRGTAAMTNGGLNLGVAPVMPRTLVDENGVVIHPPRISGYQLVGPNYS